MGNEITFEEARDGLEALGQWMECRYHIHSIGQPIQKWKMPRKEKAFFTCYAMNLVLECEGFNCLKKQKQQDVSEFIETLKKVGAKETASLVQKTLKTQKAGTDCDEDQRTRDYYLMFVREKVWLRLLAYVGQRTYMSYLERAQGIIEAGENISDFKQWQD